MKQAVTRKHQPTSGKNILARFNRCYHFTSRMDKRRDQGAVADSRLQEPAHHVTEEDHSSIVQMRVIFR